MSGTEGRIVDILSTDSTVAFLDVLGFESMLKNPDLVQEYFNSVIKSLESLNKVTLETYLISDSVVLRLPGITPESISSMCWAVANIQADLAEKNIWMRGGISVGKFFSKSFERGQSTHQVVVGNALARAYQLESKFSRYPRVLVDPRIYSELGMTKYELRDRIHLQYSDLPFQIFDPMDGKDDAHVIFGAPVFADGLWVDYASLVCADEARLRNVLMALKKSLYSGQSHYDKYRWVQAYIFSCFGRERYRQKYQASYPNLERLIEEL